MVVKLHVEGLDAFNKAVDDNNGRTIFALFSGTPGADGKNWCPDCVAADPVVESQVEKAPEDSVFIHCGVGNRDCWKDKNNVFRKDPRLNLKCVPTLLKLGTPQRLEEEDCSKASLVSMFFEGED